MKLIWRKKEGDGIWRISLEIALASTSANVTFFVPFVLEKKPYTKKAYFATLSGPFYLLDPFNKILAQFILSNLFQLVQSIPQYNFSFFLRVRVEFRTQILWTDFTTSYPTLEK
jgi:hypothetical protein